MASTKEAKFVQVIIRLGATPSYEISADERVRVKPSEAEFFASSAEGSPDSLVLDILSRLATVFGSSQPSIQISVEGTKIVEPATR